MAIYVYIWLYVALYVYISLAFSTISVYVRTEPLTTKKLADSIIKLTRMSSQGPYSLLGMKAVNIDQSSVERRWSLALGA